MLVTATRYAYTRLAWIEANLVKGSLNIAASFPVTARGHHDGPGHLPEWTSAPELGAEAEGRRLKMKRRKHCRCCSKRRKRLRVGITVQVILVIPTLAWLARQLSNVL